uniref:Translation initiation factor 3 N-terminal domain-containing protein n=1 Tax=Megaselia scalaris TaxID=36166 RepID=T1GM17_MEGSC
MSVVFRLCSRQAIFQSRILPQIQSRNLSAGQKYYAKDLESAESVLKREEKPKKNHGVKITLIGANNAPSITSLEEAQKLSKRRNLKLVQIQSMDSKTQRPVYKMLSAADLLLNEDLKKLKGAPKSGNQSQSKKPEKMLTVGSRIGDNDLNSRLKNIVKWLGKQYEIKVLIEGKSNDIESCDRILEKMEQVIKEPALIGKIVQKRKKGDNYKFNILPVKPPTEAEPAKEA